MDELSIARIQSSSPIGCRQAGRSGDLGSNRGRAFTLLELLVAISVSAVLLVILSSVVSQSGQIFQKNSNSMLAMNSAAATIDMIAKDMDCLAVTKQPYQYLLATTGTLGSMEIMMNVVSPQDSLSTSGSGSGATYPDSGLVHGIYYRIGYQDPVSASGSNNSYGIYRTMTSASTTFTNLTGLSSLSTYWSGASGQLLPDDFIAEHVVDLQVTFYNANGNAFSPGTPVAIGLSGTGAVCAATGTSSPSHAEISVTVLEEQGAQLLGNGSGSGDFAPSAIKQKYGHTLTRKVNLIKPPY